ncbi:MAG: YtxH domain-containing protein [Vicingaceae bacterium]|jgi:gas vesicle protein|tara:strand:+ start:256 stop:498 length:243 start_codon:yes stop_codon:yes gene_type:complete
MKKQETPGLIVAALVGAAAGALAGILLAPDSGKKSRKKLKKKAKKLKKEMASSIEEVTSKGLESATELKETAEKILNNKT